LRPSGAMIRFAMFGGLIDAGMLALFGCLPPGLPSGFVGRRARRIARKPGDQMRPPR
jgi:hypothetical protein